MKPHTQSHDLLKRPTPLQSAPLGLPTVHGSRATRRDPRPTNHQSQFSHHSSRVTRYCRFL